MDQATIKENHVSKSYNLIDNIVNENYTDGSKVLSDIMEDNITDILSEDSSDIQELSKKHLIKYIDKAEGDKDDLKSDIKHMNSKTEVANRHGHYSKGYKYTRQAGAVNMKVSNRTSGIDLAKKKLTAKVVPAT